MNSQKVQCVTKLHARDLLSLSLQLLQPKREATEGTTKNSEKPTKNQTEDTRMGAIKCTGMYLNRFRNFSSFSKCPFLERLLFFPNFDTSGTDF